MGCTERGGKSTVECKQEFNDCSMIAMGMGPGPTTTKKYGIIKHYLFFGFRAIWTALPKQK